MRSALAATSAPNIMRNTQSCTLFVALFLNTQNKKLNEEKIKYNTEECKMEKKDTQIFFIINLTKKHAKRILK